jgi:hypothetical protein
LLDIVTPTHLPAFLVQRIEQAGTGADENKITRDRGCGEDSALGVELPLQTKLIGNRSAGLRALSGRYGRPENCETEIKFHYHFHQITLNRLKKNAHAETQRIRKEFFFAPLCGFASLRECFWFLQRIIC